MVDGKRKPVQAKSFAGTQDMSRIIRRRSLTRPPGLAEDVEVGPLDLIGPDVEIGAEYYRFRMWLFADPRTYRASTTRIFQFPL